MGLLPRGRTPSGSVAPSWLPSPPSRRCGSPSRSSTRPARNRPPQMLLESVGRIAFFILFFYFSFLGIFFYTHDLLFHFPYVSLTGVCHRREDRVNVSSNVVSSNKTPQIRKYLIDTT